MLHRIPPIVLTAALFSVLAAPSAAPAVNPEVTIKVDALASRHPIKPTIYGVAFASSAALSDLNCPLNRSGGNSQTLYNWTLNADNRGNDWYFESIGDPSSTPGERGDSFIASCRSAGAQAMLTIPTIGWVAKLGPNRSKLAGFSIAKYGPQTGNDRQWFPDAGNGVSKATNKPIAVSDPRDVSIPSDPAFQSGWVAHLVKRWGKASGGGLRYYLLDNEPSLWHSTHRDVHPTGATMEEIRDKIIDYATMIKTIDPTALVVGPEEWGWSGYRWSGYDQQYGSLHDWSSFPDRAKHGSEDYLPWLLDQIHAKEKATGKRLLDVFSVHFYPQGGEGGNDVSAKTELLRNRSTRSLWDPDYVDESWIHAPVRLIPRLKEWVAGHDPGIQTAITEYNWGAEGNINGATAQADVLGIFGREGLDLATRWTTPSPSSPTYKAMKLYRNYDGKKSAFGEVSVSASVPDPDDLSAFAALRAVDGALTVMVIRKGLTGDTPVSIDLSGFAAGGAAQIRQLTSENAIRTLPDVPVNGRAVHLTVPAQSITLVVVPPALARPRSIRKVVRPARRSRGGIF